MYQYYLSKYKKGETDNDYRFKLTKAIQEVVDDVITEYAIKDKKIVKYSPAELWIVYDLIMDCQKYSNLDLTILSEQEIIDIAYIGVRAYKHLETKTIKTAIIRLCKALDVICVLQEDDKKIYFGGD